MAVAIAATIGPTADGAGSLPPMPDAELSASFGVSTPEAVGMDSARLLALTNWIRNGKQPIFSVLISRDGKLAYELYTSSLDRNEAHYVMSITKSVTSALVGIAIDRHLIPGSETPLSKALPHELFPSGADIRRFSEVTVKDLLGMSALDASEPPHTQTPEAIERGKEFFAARNRVIFALTQQTLPQPGVSFQYNDIGPQLATGMIEYATQESALEFAQERLFGPLGFRNADWMHQDPAGTDNGAYGLRLRPIDMQKFGILYLRGGKWNGQQIVSKAWVDLSFRPWIRSKPSISQPDYGWYWWSDNFGSRGAAHVANGWKGQRIAILPALQLVVSVTGNIEDGNAVEDGFFDDLMRSYVVPACGPLEARPPDPAKAAALADAMAQVRRESRIPANAEARMVPSIEAKDQHRPFAP
jgi:CubicO group peptidase (beta-lactamase class C family)